MRLNYGVVPPALQKSHWLERPASAAHVGNDVYRPGAADYYKAASATAPLALSAVVHYAWDLSTGKEAQVITLDPMTLDTVSVERHVYFKAWPSSTLDSIYSIRLGREDTATVTQCFHTGDRLDSVWEYKESRRGGGPQIFRKYIDSYTYDGFPERRETWSYYPPHPDVSGPIPPPPGHTLQVTEGSRSVYVRDSTGRIVSGKTYGIGNYNPNGIFYPNWRLWYLQGYDYTGSCPTSHSPSLEGVYTDSAAGLPPRSYWTRYYYDSAVACLPYFQQWTSFRSGPQLRIWRTDISGNIATTISSNGQDSTNQYLEYIQTYATWPDSNVRAVYQGPALALARKEIWRLDQNHSWPVPVQTTYYSTTPNAAGVLDTALGSFWYRYVIYDDPDGQWNTIDIYTQEWGNPTVERYIQGRFIYHDNTLYRLTSTKPVMNALHASLYPNPAAHGHTVQLDLPPGSEAQASLRRSDGAEVRRFSVAGGAQPLPIGDLAPGIYMLHLSGLKGTSTFRLAVQ